MCGEVDLWRGLVVFEVIQVVEEVDHQFHHLGIVAFIVVAIRLEVYGFELDCTSLGFLLRVSDCL